VRLEQRGRLWQREWLIGHLDTRAIDAESFLWFAPSLLALLRRDYNEWQGLPCGNSEQSADMLSVATSLWQAFDAAGAQNQPDAQPVRADVLRLADCLLQRQNPDGGWGWWTGDVSRPLQTAQAVESLLEAASAGLIEFPAANQARGLEALRRYLTSVEEDSDLRVYLLSVLSRSPSGKDLPARVLWSRHEQLSTPSLVHLGMALENIHDLSAEDKQTLISELKGRAAQTASFVWWPSAESKGMLPEGDRYATALALQAFLRWAPGDAMVGKTVDWLLRTTPAEDGRISLSVARVLVALLRSTHLQEQPTEGIVRVAQEGVPILEERVDESNPLGVHEVSLKDLRAGPNWVEILLEGSGPLYFGWSIRYALSDDDPGPARSVDGIAMQRRYLSPDTGQPSNRFDVGQFIQVSLEVTTARKLDYVVVEDFVPPGCGPIVGSVAAKELAHSDLEISPQGDRVSFLLPVVPEGKHVFTYLLRANTPGSSYVWPASTYPIYRPAIWGQSASSQLSIQR